MLRKKVLTQSIFGRDFCILKNHQGFSNGEVAVFGWNNIMKCFSNRFHDELLQFDAGFYYKDCVKQNPVEDFGKLFPQKIMYKLTDLSIENFEFCDRYYFKIKNSDDIIRLMGTAGNSGKIVFFNSKYESILDNLNQNCYLGDGKNSPIIITEKKFKKNDIVFQKDVSAIIGLYEVEHDEE